MSMVDEISDDTDANTVPTLRKNHCYLICLKRNTKIHFIIFLDTDLLLYLWLVHKRLMALCLNYIVNYIFIFKYSL